MMKVRDLIELLKDYPEDMRVVVNGYEQGYDDLSPPQISVISIALDIGTEDWEGQHGDADQRHPDPQQATTVTKALLLCRDSS